MAKLQVLIVFFMSIILAAKNNNLVKGELSKAINVKYGEIIITGYEECIVESNNVTYNYTQLVPVVPGLWFGLITYICEGKFIGTLVSKYECKPCGLFCNYNEIIPGCKQVVLPMIVGIILGVLLGLVSALAIYKFTRKITGLISRKLLLLIQRTKDVKVYKRARRYLKMDRNKEINVPFRDINNIFMNSKEVPLIKNNREKMLQKLKDLENAGDKPEYIQVIEERKLEDDNKNVQKNHETEPGQEIGMNSEEFRLEMQSKMHERRKKEDIRLSKESSSKLYATESASKGRTRIIPVFSQTSIVIILVIGLLASALSCDQTLFLTSNGKICDEDNCKDMSMSYFPLQSGSELCFKDNNNEIMHIKIQDSYYRARFDQIYYTSNTILETESYYSCKGPGNECWNGKCQLNTIGQGFQKDENNTRLVGYSCDESSIGCDDYCWHQTSCTYFKWKLTEVGNKYPIYYKTSTIWEVKIQVKYINFTRTLTLNVNNPGYNINSLTIQNIKNMPIYITSFESEQFNIESGVLLTSEGIINVPVSPIRMPQTDLIGDYQIDLNLNTRTYPTHAIKCQVNSCKVVCNQPSSKLEMLTSSYPKSLLIKDYRVSNNKHTIEYTMKVQASLSLLLGDIEINNLVIKPAKCEINNDFNFACTACNVKPYSIFTTYDIKNEGIISFISNCSYDKQYLSCNSEGTKISLLDDSEYCYIHIEQLNKTIHINYTYEFLGTLYKYGVQVSKDTTSENLLAIARSQSFITGLLNTFMFFSGFSLMSTLILRGYKLYNIKKAFEQGKKSKIEV